MKNKFKPENRIYLIHSKDKINEALRKITKCKGADVEISESHVEWNIECKNKHKDDILKEFTHTIKSLMENNNTNFEIKVLEFEHKGNEIVPLVLEKSIYLTSNDKIRANIEIQEVKGCEVKWYLRLNDKTIEEVVRKKTFLEKNYQASSKNKEHKSEFSRALQIRDIKYDKVHFYKSEASHGQRGMPDVGRLIRKGYNELSEEAKADPNSGKILYRVPQYCLKGKSEDVQRAYLTIENFLKQSSENTSFFKSDYIYKALSHMNKKVLKMLMIQLRLECGVELEIINEDKKHGFSLTGTYKKKALMLIFFHPAITIERKKKYHIYPEQWQLTKTQDVDLLHLSRMFPVKTGRFALKDDSEEFESVSAYFHNCMSKQKFEIVKIEKIQDPIRYKSYYFNLKYVQKKMEINKQKLKDFPNFEDYYPFNDEDEEGSEYVPGEKWLFHVFRYQTLKNIIEEDKSFLPIHLKDADIENPGDNGNIESKANPRPRHPLVNLGDHAIYFTHNKEGEILYSHGEHGSSETKKGSTIHHQILSRVITGVEEDKSGTILKALIDRKNNKSEHYPEGELYEQLIDIQKPDYQLGDKIGRDSNVYYPKKVADPRAKFDKSLVLPREEDEPCANCGQQDCDCLESSEIYAVYSPNRCYPAYVISYEELGEDGKESDSGSGSGSDSD